MGILDNNIVYVTKIRKSWQQSSWLSSMKWLAASNLIIDFALPINDEQALCFDVVCSSIASSISLINYVILLQWSFRAST